MKGFIGVYLRELFLLKNRLFKFIISLSINPLLYIIAFGICLGKHINIQGVSYLEFLIPGLIAGTAMIQAFSINIEINISKFYLKSFEEFQCAPISKVEYLLGEIFAGITKAFISTFIILFFAFLANIKICLSFLFFFLIFVNAFFFACLGIISALIIKSHADQSLINNLIITPMMFLSGTFFPIENLPNFLKTIIKFLPLTLTITNLRNLALGKELIIKDLFILIALCVGIFFIALKILKQK